MRAKSIVLLVLALGCGLVAALGITQVLANRGAKPSAEGETENIFVAMKDIGLGEMLTSQELRLEQWPKDKIPAGALTRIEDVENRRTKTKLYAGEPILENKLFDKGQFGGPTQLIPKGYRVVSVKVDDVSAGGNLIMPGDRVDVIIYLIRDARKGIPETVTRTFLQDVKVFAVNDQTGIDTPTDEATSTIKAGTISLLVTPKQAATLTLASELGKIRLVMRSPEDDQVATEAETNPSELLGVKEAGNRGNESLLAPEDQAAEEGSGRGLLDVIEAARSRLAAGASQGGAAGGPDSLSDAERWTIRILRPNGMDDVLLYGERQASAGGAGHGVRWRTGLPRSKAPAGGRGSSSSANVTPSDSAAASGATAPEEPVASPVLDLPPELRGTADPADSESLDLETDPGL
jgi:pilus assembly protein CpaB